MPTSPLEPGLGQRPVADAALPGYSFEDFTALTRAASFEANSVYNILVDGFSVGPVEKAFEGLDINQPGLGYSFLIEGDNLRKAATQLRVQPAEILNRVPPTASLKEVVDLIEGIQIEQSRASFYGRREPSPATTLVAELAGGVIGGLSDPIQTLAGGAGTVAAAKTTGTAAFNAAVRAGRITSRARRVGGFALRGFADGTIGGLAAGVGVEALNGLSFNRPNNDPLSNIAVSTAFGGALGGGIAGLAGAFARPNAGVVAFNQAIQDLVDAIDATDVEAALAVSGAGGETPAPRAAAAKLTLFSEKQQIRGSLAERQDADQWAQTAADLERESVGIEAAAQWAAENQLAKDATEAEALFHEFGRERAALRAIREHDLRSVDLSALPPEDALTPEALALYDAMKASMGEAKARQVFEGSVRDGISARATLPDSEAVDLLAPRTEEDLQLAYTRLTGQERFDAQTAPLPPGDDAAPQTALPALQQLRETPVKALVSKKLGFALSKFTDALPPGVAEELVRLAFALRFRPRTGSTARSIEQSISRALSGGALPDSVKVQPQDLRRAIAERYPGLARQAYDRKVPLEALAKMISERIKVRGKKRLTTGTSIEALLRDPDQVARDHARFLDLQKKNATHKSRLKRRGTYVASQLKRDGSNAAAVAAADLGTASVTGTIDRLVSPTAAAEQARVLIDQDALNRALDAIDEALALAGKEGEVLRIIRPETRPLPSETIADRIIDDIQRAKLRNALASAKEKIKKGERKLTEIEADALRLEDAGKFDDLPLEELRLITRERLTQADAFEYIQRWTAAAEEINGPAVREIEETAYIERLLTEFRQDETFSRALDLMMRSSGLDLLDKVVPGIKQLFPEGHEFSRSPFILSRGRRGVSFKIDPEFDIRAEIDRSLNALSDDAGGAAEVQSRVDEAAARFDEALDDDGGEITIPFDDDDATFNQGVVKIQEALRRKEGQLRDWDKVRKAIEAFDKLRSATRRELAEASAELSSLAGDTQNKTEANNRAILQGRILRLTDRLNRLEVTGIVGPNDNPLMLGNTVDALKSVLAEKDGVPDLRPSARSRMEKVQAVNELRKETHAARAEPEAEAQPFAPVVASAIDEAVNPAPTPLPPDAKPAVVDRELLKARLDRIQAELIKIDPERKPKKYNALLKEWAALKTQLTKGVGPAEQIANDARRQAAVETLAKTDPALFARLSQKIDGVSALELDRTLGSATSEAEKRNIWNKVIFKSNLFLTQELDMLGLITDLEQRRLVAKLVLSMDPNLRRVFREVLSFADLTDQTALRLGASGAISGVDGPVRRGVAEFVANHPTLSPQQHYALSRLANFIDGANIFIASGGTAKTLFHELLHFVVALSFRADDWDLAISALAARLGKYDPLAAWAVDNYSNIVPDIADRSMPFSEMSIGGRAYLAEEYIVELMASSLATPGMVSRQGETISAWLSRMRGWFFFLASGEMHPAIGRLARKVEAELFEGRSIPGRFANSEAAKARIVDRAAKKWNDISYFSSGEERVAKLTELMDELKTHFPHAHRALVEFGADPTNPSITVLSRQELAARIGGDPPSEVGALAASKLAVYEAYANGDARLQRSMLATIEELNDHLDAVAADPNAQPPTTGPQGRNTFRQLISGLRAATSRITRTDALFDKPETAGIRTLVRSIFHDSTDSFEAVRPVGENAAEIKKEVWQGRVLGLRGDLGQLFWKHAGEINLEPDVAVRLRNVLTGREIIPEKYAKEWVAFAEDLRHLMRSGGQMTKGRPFTGALKEAYDKVHAHFNDAARLLVEGRMITQEQYAGMLDPNTGKLRYWPQMWDIPQIMADKPGFVSAMAENIIEDSRLQQQTITPADAQAAAEEIFQSLTALSNNADGAQAAAFIPRFMSPSRVGRRAIRVVKPELFDTGNFFVSDLDRVFTQYTNTWLAKAHANISFFTNNGVGFQEALAALANGERKVLSFKGIDELKAVRDRAHHKKRAKKPLTADEAASLKAEWNAYLDPILDYRPILTSYLDNQVDRASRELTATGKTGAAIRNQGVRDELGRLRSGIQKLLDEYEGLSFSETGPTWELFGHGAGAFTRAALLKHTVFTLAHDVANANLVLMSGGPAQVAGMLGEAAALARRIPPSQLKVMKSFLTRMSRLGIRGVNETITERLRGVREQVRDSARRSPTLTGRLGRSAVASFSQFAETSADIQYHAGGSAWVDHRMLELMGMAVHHDLIKTLPAYIKVFESGQPITADLVRKSGLGGDRTDWFFTLNQRGFDVDTAKLLSAYITKTQDGAGSFFDIEKLRSDAASALASGDNARASSLTRAETTLTGFIRDRVDVAITKPSLASTPTFVHTAMGAFLYPLLSWSVSNSDRVLRLQLQRSAESVIGQQIASWVYALTNLVVVSTLAGRGEELLEDIQTPAGLARTLTRATMRTHLFGTIAGDMLSHMLAGRLGAPLEFSPFSVAGKVLGLGRELALAAVTGDVSIDPTDAETQSRILAAAGFFPLVQTWWLHHSIRVGLERLRSQRAEEPDESDEEPAR